MMEVIMKKLVIDLREVRLESDSVVILHVIQNIGEWSPTLNVVSYNTDRVDSLSLLDTVLPVTVLSKTYFQDAQKWLKEFAKAQNVKGKIEVGQYCLVRSKRSKTWKKRKLLAILEAPQVNKYICEDKHDETVSLPYYEAKPINNNVTMEVENVAEMTGYSHRIITIREV
jgi:hypothetical protein